MKQSLFDVKLVSTMTAIMLIANAKAQKTYSSRPSTHITNQKNGSSFHLVELLLSVTMVTEVTVIQIAILTDWELK